MVDLGALLSYRLSGTDEGAGDSDTDGAGGPDAASDVTVGALPDVSFREVFAPGGALVLGLGKSPMALTFGAQFLPELRDVRVNGVERPDGSVVRWSAGLHVDLPLLNLSGSQ